MFESLGDHCAHVLATTPSASVSVAVARDSSPVHAEAFGLADLEEERPATPGTAYLLASITKPIMATAVCLAAQEGLLGLDDPVEKYLDGVRLSRHRDHGVPTVREVLQHRAGLGSHFDFTYAPLSRPSTRQAIERYGTLYREPGSRFEYSNLGYGIVDAVLQAVTGQDPAEFVKDHVFAPLGLLSCHIGPEYLGPAQEAVRHTAAGGRYPVYDTSHRGASLAWATASDLVMFGLSHAGASGVLGPASVAAMRDALPVGSGLGYGLGWFVSRVGTYTVVSHSGSMGGVATMLVVVPELRLAACVLTNRTGAAVRDSVLGHLMGELVPGFTRASLPPPGGAPARETAIPSGIWEGHVDTYTGSIPLILHVRNGQVEASLDGNEPVAAQLVTATPEWDLRALFAVQLPTPDARANSPLLSLDLNQRDGVLAGAARSLKDGEQDGWLGNYLSHWCELRP
ncbi:serine hydrolase domain-containing protein [Nonomuraea sp. SBT364]|uniref:serine hydrolase domain-containing protein n=1 Tax=Nonomuraea sp. SBT364 TaxID=1580530 RepID=UPI0007C6F35D|nr:serine hydrolase domain-containing protein [Nonomuraea sp. SBT364]